MFNAILFEAKFHSSLTIFGALSERISSGKPKIENHFRKWFMIDWLVVDVRTSTSGKGK